MEMNEKKLCDGVKSDGSLDIPIAGTYLINVACIHVNIYILLWEK